MTDATVMTARPAAQPHDTVRFQLLGAVEAWAGDRRIDLGPAKQRCLLAVLLLDANQFVHVERLIDLLWGEHPHVRARNTTQVYVSRLRQALAGHPDVRLVTSGPCYRVEVDRAEVDLHQFRRLVGDTRTAAGDAQVASLLRHALALWRGAPLADVAPEHLRRTVCATLDDERLDAWEGLIDAELRMGRHAEVAGDVADLAKRHPLRERLTAQLMTALYRGGRRAEALAQYRGLRDRLAVELGIDPSPGVDELHQRILHDDPALAGTGSAPALSATSATSVPFATSVTPAPQPVPWQLPADVADFTGRAAYLDRLGALFANDPAGGTPPAVVISAIAGTAGVGKTALAVHWAHRVRDRFPDGQLYVNLRGYDPQAPVTPAEALDGFLRAMGVEAAAIPHEEADRAALYRTLLTDRRMLAVLDNARTSEQVRPLLPGAPGCAVLVTSRDNLAGLVARDGARRLALDLLPRDEACELLRRILGASRVDGEPGAAAALVDHCARLPLALRVAAELAAARPTATLAELVADLSDEQHRLDRLDAAGDEHTAVRAVFSWSYRCLPASAARAFRLLGLHPGRDTDTYAVAALLGVDVERARHVLDVLARAHLVEHFGRGRHHMHDLLRAYATERSLEEESEPQRRAALTRLLDHYLYSASTAVELLYPFDSDRRPLVPPPATATPSFADRRQAAAWLEAERANLLAAAAHAATHGWWAHTSDLSQTLWIHLHTRAHHVDAYALHTHALNASRQDSDPRGESHALAHLGGVSFRLGKYDQALDHLRRALLLSRDIGDRHGEGRTHNALGGVYFRLGRYREALDHLHQALAVAQEIGDRHGEGQMLCNLGGIHIPLGQYDRAVDYYQRALLVTRETGDRYGEGHSLNNLGLAHHRLGRHEQAIEHLRAAFAAFAEIGDRYGEAHALNNLGLAHQGLGRHDLALDHLERSLALFREIGSQSEQAEVQNDIGHTMLATHRFDGALTRHESALTIASRIRDEHQQGRGHHGLGQAQHALGDPEAARRHWQRALEIFTDLGTPEADQVRAHLAGLAAPDGSADPASHSAVP